VLEAPATRRAILLPRLEQRISGRARRLSDVAEALQVQGYDKTLTLTPGQPAAVTLLADQSGVFEIETMRPASSPPS
jgi:hypothetical protein